MNLYACVSWNEHDIAWHSCKHYTHLYKEGATEEAIPWVFRVIGVTMVEEHRPFVPCRYQLP